MKKSLILSILLTSILIATGCNGKQGEQGPQGNSGTPGEQGPQGPQGNSGPQGEPGVSIVSITKTESQGLIDIYTIYYSDGHTSTFSVTNGAQGEQGAPGVQGEPGADGHTPIITISEDGYWVIDGEKTQYIASAQPNPGPGGSSSSSNPPSSSTPSSSSSQAPSSSSSTSSSSTPSSSSSIVPPKTYAFENFQSAINSSAPTKISNTQTYSIDSEDITLNFSSLFVVSYGAVVKSAYTYSYEKLNELSTGYESMISVVSNTIYSTGSKVGDGVDFVTEAESSVALKGLDFKEDYLTYTIAKNKMTASVKSDKVKNFFANDYKINNVSFILTIDDQDRLAALDLSFETNAYMGNLYSGSVHSISTYSYNLEVVDF